MIKKLLLTLLILACVLGLAMHWASGRGEEAFRERGVAAFLALEDVAAERSPRSYDAGELAQLPEPAAQYLRAALPPDGLAAWTVTLEQTGRTIMSEDGSWDDFQARQVISVDPPGMVWAARVDWLPLVPITTMIVLGQSEAKVESHLWGLLKIFTNQGEGYRRYLLMRWLAEAVWHPAALLPGGPVTWQAAEPPAKGVTAARAELTVGGVSAGGLFIFPAAGGPPMMFLGDPESSGPFAGQRWYCTYSDWRKEGRVLAPYSMVQGARRGIGDDQRLQLKVTSLQRR